MGAGVKTRYRGHLVNVHQKASYRHQYRYVCGISDYIDTKLGRFEYPQIRDVYAVARKDRAKHEG